MTRRLTLLDVATAIVAAVIATGAVWVAVRGPTGPLPMHFGIDGQPDRWGARAELATLLGFMAALIAVAGGGLGLYAARTDEPSRRRGLRIGQLILLVVLGVLTPLMAAHILSYADNRGNNEAVALYGSPEAVGRQVEALEAAGVRYLLASMGGGSRESLRRFAREIIPRFTEDTPSAAVFRIGDDVTHAAFGEGVVTGVDAGGVVVVRFASDGSERRLMADYAPIRKR